MTPDQILLTLLVIGVYALVGLAAWGCHRLHVFGYAPSAEQVEALTDAVSEHVAATKVNNAIAPGLFKQLEAMVHKLTTHAAAPAPAAAAPDPHPAGMVAAPAIPVVMPSAVQPVAPADLAAMLAHMQVVAEHMRMLAVPTVEQNPAATPSGFSAVALGAGGAGGTPEPTAQPMTIADPAPTVQPTVAAPGVAA